MFLCTKLVGCVFLFLKKKENEELTEEVLEEHKAAIKSRNMRVQLEDTVQALRAQLAEDEVFVLFLCGF